MARLPGTTALLLAIALAAGGCEDACPDGQTRCAGACRDAAFFLSDADNCGACGVACGLGACADGACQCDAGATPCPAANPLCVDLLTDAQHCGACEVACRSDQLCLAGGCQCGGLAECGDACCAGPCCGSRCQTAHANGLGQTYHDCGALDAWTLEQARLAAQAWSPSGPTQEEGICSVNCVCRESTGQAAVWCYTGSNAPGYVRVSEGPFCRAALCPMPGIDPRWH